MTPDELQAFRNAIRLTEYQGRLVHLYNIPSEQMEQMLVDNRISRMKEELRQYEIELSREISERREKHLRHRLFYFLEVIEIVEIYNFDLRRIIQSRKCQAILSKITLLTTPPAIYHMDTSIPLDVFLTVDLKIYPHMDSFALFRKAYDEWFTRVAREPEKGRAASNKLVFFSELYDEPRRELGKIIQIRTRNKEVLIELIMWSNTIHWMRKQILPRLVVDDLMKEGLTYEEIQILFPEHLLPSQRLE